jgi:hypothetical protein
LTDTYLIAVLVVLMGAAFAWLALAWRLFAIMKLRVPETYASIGSPHLFFNNTLSNNLLFVRFLLGGRYAKVGDDGVRRLCAFLRALFWFFAAGSVAFVAVMLAVHRA